VGGFSNQENAMPFQRVPNCVEIVIVGVMSGQEIVNTHYATMEGYALADVQNLADDVDGWVNAYWRPIMPQNYSYARTDVRGLNAAVDLQASSIGHAGPGAIASDCKANNIALSVKRSSGLTGRASRGRIYVPVPDDVVTTESNTVSTEFETALITALNALSTAVEGVGFLPVIVHRVGAGVPLAEAVVYTLVEWVVVDKVLDSMRRRLPKRGV
jgi:hypothetical protein